jgi:hypothetical protein
MNDHLKTFLQTNLPKAKSGKSKFVLGVQEDKLGSAIQEELGVTCQVCRYS